MADQVLEAQCLQNVVVEERHADGSVERTELSPALALKKEMGNARLVSDDAMLWVAHGVLESQRTDDDRHHVTVANGKRKFSFFLASNADADAFLHELRAQVDGKHGLEAKRKKRKIRQQRAEHERAGFVPVVHTLPPATPTKRRSLGDATNSPRLAPPLSMAVHSTVTEAQSIAPSPAKSPFRSPFRSPFGKKTAPSPRVATPIVSLSSLPPKSPAVPSSVSSTSSASPALRPREWLSPARVRVQLTPPSVRRDGSTPSSASRDDKENTPVRTTSGIVNKRVRSLQRMLDDVPREDVEHAAGARPPQVRSPYFLSPTNAREMSPVRRPTPAKKLRSPMRPLGELHQNHNTTPPLRPLSASSTPGSHELGLRKVTHGLLNLGNFCYMNAIVQSLAALPGFADHLQHDDWLVPIIQKYVGADRSAHEIAELLVSWKNADTTERLAVQDKLAVLLQQVIAGSDTAINPEPLKNVMGRRNPRFASHFQQDAHEFLLQLVTEYEKELATAVNGVAKAAKEDAASANAPPQPTEAAAPTEAPAASKKVSLLNFFRRTKTTEETEASTTAPAPSEDPAPTEASTATPPKSDDQEALVAELYPAECFRTELYRTLTCCSCAYSRRQVERFYDFSLDLPFVPPPKSPEQEPQTEPLPAGPPSRQCHCGVDAVVIESTGNRFYSCAKSACSLRDKVEEVAPEPEPKPEPKTDEAAAVPAPSQPVMERPSFRSIPLADLLRDQFQSETLELTCEKCKDGKEATARYDVKSLPRVLVLHLKRFEVNPRTGSLYKRCDLVEAPTELFPVQNIHASDSTATDEVGNPRYTIKSVVHHLGKTVDEGHYVADVCGPRGHWRRRNDTHETLIGEDFALRSSRSQESCYMIFYVLAEPTDAQERDKENLSTPTAAPPTPTRSPIVTTSTTPDSPASLVGRRRELTPPRRDASKVSKSLHNLL